MKKLALVMLVALALPSSALAKGPSKASVAGPGVTTITISGAEGSATPFWRLVEATGWFQAAYGPMLPQTPPAGELGPRYTITWAVPSSNRLQQDVYPYAKPYPVTYMPRGQEIYDRPVKGGWFAGDAKLEQALGRVGLPAQAPPSTASSSLAQTRAPGGLAAAAALFALATSLPLRSSGAAGT